MNKVKPTTKQVKALRLIREGKRPVQAMREAGYSKLTSTHPGNNLLRSEAAKSIFDEFKDEYAKLGITTAYMASKTAEWLEAKKPIGAKILVTKDGQVIDADNEGAIEVPDYQTQIKAAELFRKDIGMDNQKNESSVNVQVNTFLADERNKYEI